MTPLQCLSPLHRAPRHESSAHPLLAWTLAWQFDTRGSLAGVYPPYTGRHRAGVWCAGPFLFKLPSQQLTCI